VASLVNRSCSPAPATLRPRSACLHDLFVVANDEDNVLALLSASASPGRPCRAYDLKSAAHQQTQSLREAIMEGAARVGRIFSSSRRTGAIPPANQRPARHRFFALSLAETNGVSHCSTRSARRTTISSRISRAMESIKAFDLADAAGLAPKAPGGFNIEALTATPDRGRC
jgi:hypothetical protein